MVGPPLSFLTGVTTGSLTVTLFDHVRPLSSPANRRDRRGVIAIVDHWHEDFVHEDFVFVYCKIKSALVRHPLPHRPGARAGGGCAVVCRTVTWLLASSKFSVHS